MLYIYIYHLKKLKKQLEMIYIYIISEIRKICNYKMIYIYMSSQKYEKSAIRK